jgi:hypothetical protein
MSTLISIAIAKQYSRTSCSDGTEGTENKNHWQFTGNKWLSLIRKHILWNRFLWMTGRWSSVILGCERERESGVARQCDKKCRKAAFRNPILPGLPTTSIPRFDPSFLPSYRLTSHQIVERHPLQDGRSLSSRILLIQAFANSFLVRSLLSLARDEIPPHSLSGRV